MLIRDWRYRDGISPLVKLVAAFEQLQRVQLYLYSATYASDVTGTLVVWAAWDDITSAVEILSDSEQALRAEVAKRIGASLNN
jgi:hypothetical protein